MENQDTLEHEITVKYATADDEEGINESAKFSRITKDPIIKFKLYDITKLSTGTSWKIIYYEVVKVTPDTPIIGQCKIEYKEKITTIPISQGEEILFLDLINRFQYGRVLIGYEYPKRKKIWGLAPGFYARDIYFRQVKKILTFEHKAFMIPKLKTDEEKEALRCERPSTIPTRIDFGEYCIESWGGGGASSRKNYSYITNDDRSKQWIEKLCLQSA